MNFNITKNYRPEIDGLRALAVILILLFHADFQWIGGGFIGVDVFFVISGYLITRNITFQIQQQSFSFSQFYINRLRRLMPALFFTLFVTLILGFYVFSPNDLERLGKSSFSALFSVSNFFFWFEADYFNPSSNIKPLLHTWSLAVEEQFYLIWPALLVTLFWLKNKKALFGFFWFSILSYSYFSQKYIENNPEAVFFLLPFRFFEFSLGALCVFYNRKFQQSYLSNFAFIVGLLLIIVPAITFSKDTVFPGMYALIPCIGTVVIILIGQSSNFHILLNNKIFVKIGLFSYSVYLIHWPLFVFYKYWRFESVSLFETVFLLAFSLLAGYLMWRFIENPFRFKKSATSKQKTSSRLFLLSLLLIGSALFFTSNYLWKNQGIPSRMPAEFLMSESEVTENKKRFRKNFSRGKNDLLEGDASSNKVVIMGNSHAVDLIYMMRENGSRLNFKLLSTSARCFNFGAPVKAKFADYCKKRIKFNIKADNYEGFDAVYLHDNWPRFDGKDLLNRLTQLRSITQLPIYVIGPKMTYMKPVPQIVSAHMRMASINQYNKKFMVNHKISTNNSIKSLLEKHKDENVYFVDLLRSQCGEKIDSCKIVSEKNEKFLYFDGGHLTLQGARELGKSLKENYPNLF